MPLSADSSWSPSTRSAPSRRAQRLVHDRGRLRAAWGRAVQRWSWSGPPRSSTSGCRAQLDIAGHGAHQPVEAVDGAADQVDIGKGRRPGSAPGSGSGHARRSHRPAARSRHAAGALRRRPPAMRITAAISRDGVAIWPTAACISSAATAWSCSGIDCSASASPASSVMVLTARPKLCALSSSARHFGGR